MSESPVFEVVTVDVLFLDGMNRRYEKARVLTQQDQPRYLGWIQPEARLFVLWTEGNERIALPREHVRILTVRPS